MELQRATRAWDDNLAAMSSVDVDTGLSVLSFTLRLTLKTTELKFKSKACHFLQRAQQSGDKSESKLHEGIEVAARSQLADRPLPSPATSHDHLDMTDVAPRVNGARMNDYIGRTVRLMCKITKVPPPLPPFCRTDLTALCNLSGRRELGRRGSHRRCNY